MNCVVVFKSESLPNFIVNSSEVLMMMIMVVVVVVTI
jgi:hypothetical protein